MPARSWMASALSVEEDVAIMINLPHWSDTDLSLNICPKSPSSPPGTDQGCAPNRRRTSADMRIFGIDHCGPAPHPRVVSGHLEKPDWVSQMMPCATAYAIASAR